MGLKVDGGVSLQSDGGVTEPGSTGGGAPVVPNNPTPPHGQSTVVPFKPDGGVPKAAINQAGNTGPTVKASELQSQVELCKRPANIGPLGQLGVAHHWLRTANKEVGMGQSPGTIPGHGEAPPVGRATQWIDHSAEKEKTCEVVPDVDVACVERETEFGRSTGDWFPFTNDCHTRTQEVLDKCSTKPKKSGPDFDDPRKSGAGYSL